MLTKPRLPEDYAARARESAAEYEARHAGLPPHLVIEIAARSLFPGQVTAVSSFGADSAVLLHMMAAVDRSLPVAFLDTGKHFDETLAYRDAIVRDFGLSNLSVIHPLDDNLAKADPDGRLHKTDTEGCCAVRKVEPMARAVAPWAAWFTGRKRFQSATRAALPVFEAVGERVRINPLAHWSAAHIRDYALRNGLRENPLVAYGYQSIGCLPCTDVVKPGEDARSGRWAGAVKTECGIHLSGLEQSLNSSGH